MGNLLAGWFPWYNWVLLIALIVIVVAYFVWRKKQM